MQQTLDKLWNEYLSEECAKIETDEERALNTKAAEMHEKLNSLLDEEESEALQSYIDAVYEGEEAFIKKAFFKGVELALALVFP